MSYADQAALVNNGEWMQRVLACVREQALLKDPPDALSQAVLAEPLGVWPSNVGALVAGQPGMSAESTDADILSAVQAVWPKIASSMGGTP